jgi:hypothetical protein
MLCAVALAWRRPAPATLLVEPARGPATAPDVSR